MPFFVLKELEKEDLVFNNESRPEEEAFSIELCDRRGEPHGANFALWQNGELIATYASFVGLQSRADKIILEHKLEKAQ